MDKFRRKNIVSLSRAVRKFTSDLHTTRTPTQSDRPEVVLTQFVSPDNVHGVLDTCREIKIKINT